MNATMRRILLAGAPTGCWTNLGDEAILAGMTTSLRATWSEVALTVVSSNPPGFLDRYDCQAVPFRDVEAIAEAVAASDLVLLGGGSIFYDYWACDPGATLTPRHAATSLLAGTALLAAAYQRPLMVYGAGVEPLSSAAGRLLAGAVFELADVICLRDRGSVAALETFDLEAVTATVTGDAALGMTLPPAAPLLDLPPSLARRGAAPVGPGRRSRVVAGRDRGGARPLSREPRRQRGTGALPPRRTLAADGRHGRRRGGARAHGPRRSRPCGGRRSALDRASRRACGLRSGASDALPRGVLRARGRRARGGARLRPEGDELDGRVRPRGLHRGTRERPRRGARKDPRARLGVAGSERFTDVPASNPFCPWVEELARQGITSGCTTTMFCPLAPATRQEMAVFIVRTAAGGPVASANVAADGTVRASFNRIGGAPTVSHAAGSGIYNITFPGLEGQVAFSHAIALVSLGDAAGGQISRTSLSGNAQVRTFNSTGVATDLSFEIVVFVPGTL